MSPIKMICALSLNRCRGLVLQGSFEGCEALLVSQEKQAQHLSPNKHSPMRCFSVFPLLLRDSLHHTFASTSAQPQTTTKPFSGQSERGIFTAISSPPTPKKYNQRRLVGWTPEQFYKVVSDVDHYRHFVPWCQKSHVVTRKGGLYMEAELEVGFQMLVERYTSKIHLEPNRLVSSKVGNSLLFHHLDSTWQMEPGPTPESCWLTFKIDFAFNSALYGNLADIFFSEVVKQMVNAFEGRCSHLYGPSSMLKGTKGKGLPTSKESTQNHSLKTSIRVNTSTSEDFISPKT